MCASVRVQDECEDLLSATGVHMPIFLTYTGRWSAQRVSGRIRLIYRFRGRSGYKYGNILGSRDLRSIRTMY